VEKLDAEFVNARRTELQHWLSEIADSVQVIFNNDSLANQFAQLFGPTQIGDKKGQDFVFPFKVFHA
jgi:hypothetical protein